MPKPIVWCSAPFLLIALYIASLYDYLLFHSLAEGFAVVIAGGIFMVAWNTRQFNANRYLLFIGIAYLFVGMLDAAHTLSYRGMNILPDNDANAPTQLWIAARYMESLTLLAAPLMLHRRTRVGFMIQGYAVAALLVLVSIFYWHNFPDAYLQNAGGLTTFKIASEYVICVILLISGVLLFRHRTFFEGKVLGWLMAAIMLTILAELAFTRYASVYGFSNLLGHYLKIASFFFIYKALIQTSLAEPYDTLFRDLNRQRKLMTVTLASIGDAVITTDPSGRVNFLNSVAEQLSGWRSADAAGRPIREIFRVVNEDTRAAVEDPVEKALRTGTIVGLANHSVLIRKDGTELPIDDSAAPIRDENDRILGAVLVFRDITERKQGEKRLQKLNEDLERRVAERTRLAEGRARQLQALAVELIEAEERERRRIAQLLHDDLQQLMAAAKMQLQAARAGSSPDPMLQTAERVLEDAIATSRRLSHELNPPALYHAGMAAALQGLARQMEEQFGLHVDVKTEADPPLENMSLKLFVFRAVQEILFNTVKHAGADQAEIVLATCDHALSIAISDSGRGFDPRILDDGGRKYGFGLLSIRERAGHVGGSLNVRSTPGEGSRFELTLPLGIDAAEEPHPMAPPAEQQHPALEATAAVSNGDGIIRVLFADDHKVMRQGLIALIAGQPDIEVAGEAANGREAIEQVRRLQPDVIVMDVSMPEMDGVEATRRIKAEFPDIRIIGLSMSEDDQIGRSMHQAGAETILRKTASSSELLEAIYGFHRRAEGPGPEREHTFRPGQN